jgi:threonine/homoserine/homoserine lactone efflux protein
VHRALFEGIAVEALNVETVLFFLAFLPSTIRARPAERNSERH